MLGEPSPSSWGSEFGLGEVLLGRGGTGLGQQELCKAEELLLAMAQPRV